MGSEQPDIKILRLILVRVGMYSSADETMKKSIYCSILIAFCVLLKMHRSHAEAVPNRELEIEDRAFVRPCFRIHDVNQAVKQGRMELLARSKSDPSVAIFLDYANKTLIVLAFIDNEWSCSMAAFDNVAVEKGPYRRLKKFLLK